MSELLKIGIVTLVALFIISMMNDGNVTFDGFKVNINVQELIKVIIDNSIDHSYNNGA